MDKIKLGIISDTHGNLPALEIMLQQFKDKGCDEVLHLGDVMGIGAFSKECLDLLIAQNVTMIKGNHELLYLVGIDNLRFPMPEPMASHHKQVHKFLGDGYKDMIKEQPFFIHRNYFGKKVTFCHYGTYDATDGLHFFRPIINPSVDQIEAIFRNEDADVIFFGHEHHPFNHQGQKLYVDVGSLGCNRQDFANGVVATFSEQGVKIEHLKIPNDKTPLFNAMQDRQIVNKDAISQQYFGKK